MRHTLDFKRWLSRLGIKRQDAPDLIPQAQPVVLVGDHTNIVSQPIDVSYIVGGAATGDAGNYGAFFGYAPVPMRIRTFAVHSATAQSVSFFFRPGIPAVLAPTPLTPFVMRGEAVPRGTWGLERDPNPLGVDVPSLRMPSQPLQSWIIVPPGVHFWCQQAQLASQFSWYALVDELPDESVA